MAETPTEALVQALEAENVAYRARYSALLQAEIRFLMERDEEEIAIALLLH